MCLLCPSREIILAENNFVLNYCGKKKTTTNQSQATGFDFGVLFENLQTKICPSKEIILAENNFILIDYGKKETTTKRQKIGFDFGSSV